MLPETQQTWADVVRGASDERFARVLCRSETTVAGVRAVRLETETTGEGLLERGTRQLAYVLDRDGAAWILQTTSRRGDGDYEARKNVLERAVQTFRFDE